MLAVLLVLKHLIDLLDFFDGVGHCLKVGFNLKKLIGPLKCRILWIICLSIEFVKVLFGDQVFIPFDKFVTAFNYLSRTVDLVLEAFVDAKLWS